MNRLLSLALATIAVMALLAYAIGAGRTGSSGPADAASAEAASARPSHQAHNPWSRDTARSSDTAPGSAPGEALMIARDGGGQFHVDGEINGGDARFVVDTGADTVALTVADAERLGIAVSDEDFQPIVRSASGAGYGARVRLERLGIGGQELDDVPAVVVRGLSVNLLGQSALRRLGKVELRGDRMVIVPD
ncbi:retropepsin-like aspartic protease family protein [Novosphingobium lentum]|uniref:retropepsin-like aspartic protease family protein n=1 Tax=Novosphingobium lentum TaxID=145287 RepID=UPI00082CD7D9|nr:TIGR02281 family clan AA aspartic protease [Novosphingobium lentum]